MVALHGRLLCAGLAPDFVVPMFEQIRCCCGLEREPIWCSCDDALPGYAEAGARQFRSAEQYRDRISSWRNCLENRNGSRIGATKAAKMGQRSPDQPTLGAKDLRSRRLQLFSKQFRKGCSANFASTGF
jgi:hypothetical protein